MKLVSIQDGANGTRRVVVSVKAAIKCHSCMHSCSSPRERACRKQLSSQILSNALGEVMMMLLQRLDENEKNHLMCRRRISMDGWRTCVFIF